jgi:hypothetical protein
MEVRRLRCEHRFRYVSRDVSLVVAFLMGLGVFLLPLRASGSEMPSALAMANSPRVDQETNGNGHPLDGIYLVAPGEEAEDADKYPLNAELLTMLLLAVSFGLSVGWLLRNAQRQGAPIAIVILGGLVTSTLLNVFVLPSLYPRFGRSDRAVKGNPAGK